MPTVSIITPTYNCAATIGGCLRSIYSQDLPAGSLQHLVMDGGSTDETLAQLGRYADARSTIVSEKDSGTYDAINKGIRRADGEYIGILGADDVFAGRDVLASLLLALQDTGAQTAYGDLEYVSQVEPNRVVRYWHSGPYDRNRFRWGWMPPHPTFFVHRSIYEAHGRFRDDMSVSADYEIMLRFLFRHQVDTVYVPKCLVRMRLGGLSNTPRNLWRKSQEDLRACKMNGVWPAPWVVGCKILRKIPQFVRRNRQSQHGHE